MKAVTLPRALADRTLLGAALGDPATWSTWLVVLKAAFGLKLDDEELEVFAGVAGSRAPPRSRVRELWAVVGRRGGKSRIAAALAVYFAVLRSAQAGAPANAAWFSCWRRRGAGAEDVCLCAGVFAGKRRCYERRSPR